MHASQTGKRPFSCPSLPLNVTNRLPVNAKLISHHFRSHTNFFACIRFLNFAMSPCYEQKMDAQAWLHFQLLPRHLNICARNKQLSPYTCFINSTFSAAVFPSLKHSLIFDLCSMPLLWPRPLTTSTTWRCISRHVQRGGVAVFPDSIWRLVTWMACIVS